MSANFLKEAGNLGQSNLSTQRS